jgi:hypothetical protein
MPISGPASYLSTTDETLGHWESADTTLGVGNELKLKDGSGRAVLVTQKDLLVTKRAAVQAKLNQQEVARGDIEVRKAALLVRINQFNDKVRFLLGGTKWERALPQVPTQGDGQGKFTEPLDDAAALWLMINDDPAVADIILLGATTQAMFVADVAALNLAFTTYTTAGKKLDVAIEERNDVQDVIYEMLKQYRQAVPTFFAKGDAILDSLPVLTPAPGSTPAAVTASGVFDQTQQKAKLSSTASNDPNLFQIEWRYCVGPNYSTDLEAVVPGGNIPPGGNLEIFTDAGLPTEGSVATFRAYTITTTGNEKGSNTVTITWPIAPLPPP